MSETQDPRFFVDCSSYELSSYKELMSVCDRLVERLEGLPGSNVEACCLTFNAELGGRLTNFKVIPNNAEITFDDGVLPGPIVISVRLEMGLRSKIYTFTPQPNSQDITVVQVTVVDGETAYVKVVKTSWEERKHAFV